ncbi:MAG: hypothetical protein JST50_13805 [Bacteroidetes bacterium]|nr:hypothetical protein [Bacteroidota bacterium]
MPIDSPGHVPLASGSTTLSIAGDKKGILLLFLFYPLCVAERGEQRSAFGVSCHSDM